MLRIRDEQLAAYQNAALVDFVERGVAHLRDVLADETRPYSDDELRARIRGCVGRAKRYGLSTERQVIAFVEATYLAGEGFDTDPRCDLAGQLLADPTISPGMKAADLRLALPTDLGGE